MSSAAPGAAPAAAAPKEAAWDAVAAAARAHLSFDRTHSGTRGAFPSPSSSPPPASAAAVPRVPTPADQHFPRVMRDAPECVDVALRRELDRFALPLESARALGMCLPDDTLPDEHGVRPVAAGRADGGVCNGENPGGIVDMMHKVGQSNEELPEMFAASREVVKAGHPPLLPGNPFIVAQGYGRAARRLELIREHLTAQQKACLGGHGVYYTYAVPDLDRRMRQRTRRERDLTRRALHLLRRARCLIHYTGYSRPLFGNMRKSFPLHCWWPLARFRFFTIEVPQLSAGQTQAVDDFLKSSVNVHRCVPARRLVHEFLGPTTVAGLVLLWDYDGKHRKDALLLEHVDHVLEFYVRSYRSDKMYMEAPWGGDWDQPNPWSVKSDAGGSGASKSGDTHHIYDGGSKSGGGSSKTSGGGGGGGGKTNGGTGSPDNTLRALSSSPPNAVIASLFGAKAAALAQQHAQVLPQRVCLSMLVMDLAHRSGCTKKDLFNSDWNRRYQILLLGLPPPENENVCVLGNCLVDTVVAGSDTVRLRPAQDLCVGDLVRVGAPPSHLSHDRQDDDTRQRRCFCARIVATTRQPVEPDTKIVQVGAQLYITPDHPVRWRTWSPQWAFPRQVRVGAKETTFGEVRAADSAAAPWLINFVLGPATEAGAAPSSTNMARASSYVAGGVECAALSSTNMARATSYFAGGVECAALGHGVVNQGDVLAHPFWGTEAVVEMLRALPDWPTCELPAHGLRVPQAPPSRPIAALELACGRGTVPLLLPPTAVPTVIRKHVLRHHQQQPLQGEEAAIDAALSTPVGGLACSIETVARGATSACILICDITRPVPNRLFLRRIVCRLIGCGVPLERITILIATGLHRPNLGAELAELVGDPWVLENVRVLNNYARRDEDFVHLGMTPPPSNVPVRLNRVFVEADCKICTGLVEPHFMAGFSGGRKVIAPGVAHHTLIRTFHSARFMEDPMAVACNLVDNPLHAAQLEIVRMVRAHGPAAARPILALNTVLDERRRLVFASFGEIISSHAAAVAHVRKTAQVYVPRRFKTVVTSAGGFPLDQTFYQTVKGMVTPLDVLEDGGTLIVVSDCAEGMGSAEFVDAQRKLLALGPRAFVDSLTQKSLADIDEWQTEELVKSVGRAGEVVLVAPKLAADAPTGVSRSDDLGDAVAAALSKHAGHDGTAPLAVIPEGPYVIPFFRPEEANMPSEGVKGGEGVVDPVAFLAALRGLGVDRFIGVPDSTLAPLLSLLEDAEGVRHTSVANEGVAVALAVGHTLSSQSAGGDAVNVPCVYLQNSGLGNATNPLLSLASPSVYACPMLLLVGWRGDPGRADQPQHRLQGAITPGLLDLMNIPWWDLAQEAGDVQGGLQRALDATRNPETPVVAVVVRRGCFAAAVAPATCAPDACLSLRRGDVLRILVDRFPPASGARFVATTGFTSRELYQLRDARQEGHGQDFLNVGAMGHASSNALGLAETGTAGGKVVCVDGDGAAIMHLGAWCSIGAARASDVDLLHVVFENGQHESVGGQATAAGGVGGVDLAGIARACGYPLVFAVETADAFEAALATCAGKRGLAMVVVKGAPGFAPGAGKLKRPTVPLRELKAAFCGNGSSK